jgi:hypothetical protein
MAGKSSENQALVDAIKQAIKEGLKDGGQSNREVEREIRTLNKTLEKYIENIKASGDIRGSFGELSEDISKTITSAIAQNDKKKEQEYNNFVKSVFEKQQDIERKKENLKEEKAKGMGISPEQEREMQDQIQKAVKGLENFTENYLDKQEKQEAAFKKQMEETRKQLFADVASGFKSLGEKTFKNVLKDDRDIDKALGNYKKALQEQYTSLIKDKKLREQLNVTDEDLKNIKEDLHDSYLRELEKQRDSDKIDDNLRKALNDRLKREKILAGRATYEQTYGGGSSLAKLAGRLADFTSKRFKQENEKTSESGKIFNAGLAALFKGKEDKKPFLETEEEPNMAVQSRPSDKVTLAPKDEETADEVAASEAKESVNTSPQVEALNAIQQTFEEAKENVPFKVVISNIDPTAEKSLTTAFSNALRESFGLILGGNQPKLLGAPSKEKEKKSKDKDKDIIDVDDLNKLGFFRRAGKFLGRAGRGIGSAARGFSNLATGGVGIGGLLGTNVGAIGSLGAGAVATSGALAAGTAYAGYKGGSYLEDEFGLGTKALESVGVNKEANQQEVLQEDLNKNLQEVSKIKDPNERRIKYFETQLETLEKQKTIQSGDEKAQTERMITVVKGKLEKLKNPPKIEPAPVPAPKVETAPEIGSSSTPGPVTIPSVTVNPAITEVKTAEAQKAVQGTSSLPTVTAKIPQPKDVTPELNTNNQLTQQTNQILGELLKTMAGKDYNPTSVTPVMVAQAAPSSPTSQTQSAAYQFRSQNRLDS